ncbi:MAG TPA: hypothetical protein VHA73_14385 [Acidimicrobiales bacterium]|nr:hypothetical protein [Acidimicrobiales bacterium]
MALTEDPFADLDLSAYDPPTRPKTATQLTQLVYSHLLTAKADYEAAADGNEVSATIATLNGSLRKRGALADRDSYEQVCRDFLQDALGKGFI